MRDSNSCQQNPPSLDHCWAGIRNHTKSVNLGIRVILEIHNHDSHKLEYSVLIHNHGSQIFYWKSEITGQTTTCSFSVLSWNPTVSLRILKQFNCWFPTSFPGMNLRHKPPQPIYIYIYECIFYMYESNFSICCHN